MSLLLLSFPRAARGYLLSPLSFVRLHTLFVWSLMLFPQSFSSLHVLRVDGTLLLWSPCACSPVRGTGAATPACTTHVVRPCFEGLSGRRLHVVNWSRAPWPLLASGVPWLIKPIRTQLFCIMMSCDSCRPSLHVLTPVPRGQRAQLDEFRALLIDRSAELVESFLPSRSRTWRRSSRAPVTSSCY